MKTLLIILGISLYGTPGVALQKEPCCGHGNHDHGLAGITEIYPSFEASLREQGNTAVLDASSIRVIKVEEEANLGFDTAAYLPEGFDAYGGKVATWVDLGLIETDTEEPVDLGFDTKPYLPAGFDPYQGMTPAWEDVSTEALQTALWRSGWLERPASLVADLHPGSSVGLDALGLIDAPEEEIDLGFDTARYLPVGFDPYQGMALNGGALKKTSND